MFLGGGGFDEETGRGDFDDEETGRGKGEVGILSILYDTHRISLLCKKL